MSGYEIAVQYRGWVDVNGVREFDGWNTLRPAQVAAGAVEAFEASEYHEVRRVALVPLQPDSLVIDLEDLRDGESVWRATRGVTDLVLTDALGNVASGPTLADAQAGLDAVRAVYANDPARSQ